MASRIAPWIKAQRLYKFQKPNILESDGAHLPESYKKFYREWKLTEPQPVHYIPYKSEWQRNDETGEVKRVQNVPLSVSFPPESHKGIWGGEGVIKGFQKRQRTKQRVPHFWVPNLVQTVVFSEILNKRFSVTVTNRTIDLILENNGFDNYILNTKACDLQSGLALKIKRKMLLALLNKDVYPDDPLKAKEVNDKYSHYLKEYTKEDIDWYGWTIDEALKKYEKESEETPVPLKIKFRQELLAKLASPQEQDPGTDEIETSQTEERSWIRKLNPFSKT